MAKSITAKIPVRAKNLVGEKFGRLTVSHYAGKSNSGVLLWACRCQCGKETVVFRSNLTSGGTRSCGCLQEETYIICGQKSSQKRIVLVDGVMSRNHPYYAVWAAMRSRCNNKRNPNYKDYGGRGIKVCKRWESFKKFVDDMGERAEGLTIERVDNMKGYDPDNCIWATYKQQANNRRKRKAA